VSKLSEARREIQALDIATAHHRLAEERRRLFDLRLQKERGEVKDNRQFAKTRKQIARLMQHINELDHAAALEAIGALNETTNEG
jgi:large subunit ribosomal protein L29